MASEYSVTYKYLIWETIVFKLLKFSVSRVESYVSLNMKIYNEIVDQRSSFLNH